MSQNGIGLQTPRGSGTSGYVQKSLSERRNEGFRQKREREADEENRKHSRLRKEHARKGAGAEIIEHDRKRWIELKCLELRDELEDNDVEDEKIELQIKALREKLTNRQTQTGDKAPSEKLHTGKKDVENDQREVDVKHKEENTAKPDIANKTITEASGLSTIDDKATENRDNSKISQRGAYEYVPRFKDR